MIDLGPVAFLRPLWFLMIPVLIGMAFLASKRADGFARWRSMIDPALLPTLMRLGHVDLGARDFRPWVMAVSGVLMAIGLSGPAKRNEGAPIFRNLNAIMIVLDVSPSIVEGGGLPDAQASVARLLDRSGTRPVALSVFSGESFLVSVPTEEPQALKSSIAVLDTDTMPVGGSRPDRALALARQTLIDADAENADVVIVTDGGGIGPDALYEAGALAQGGVRVSGVFVNHKAPPYGVTPASPEQLERLAEDGGGIVVSARNLGPLEGLLAARRSLSAQEQASRAILFTDYGPWFFLAGLLALLPIYRQRREI
ncbi:vWA domain-containing protein [Roseibium algae]|uniref:VWA domain-containing protein n=1 Tax=Roseibium algae TaxID=3123038 RepID=A0ABU8TMG7_9HYPH